jgi:proteasome lid subunit RPN8/RPN11
MTEPVRIPRAIANQILRQAERTPEEEICGLISGKDGALRHCLPVANVAGDRARLFEMDPKGQIDAMRRIREQGEELVAIYHSHPQAPAAPSLTDIARHEYPGVLYLIVSLATEGVIEMRGFRIHGERIEEVPLSL